MKHRTKLTQQEHSEEEARQQIAPQTQPREFASVEDLLRHDAAQTPVPSELTRRIQATAAAMRAPKRGWWARLFGR